jgi:hypothetical protein
VWEEERGVPAPDSGKWDLGAIERYIAERLAKRPDAKGAKILTDLSHTLGFDYRKPVHGIAIAMHLDPEAVSDLRPLFAPLFS